MLKVSDVNLKIKGKEILKNISLELKDGECFALLGPNGAGKSTLIDIITGVIKAEKGNVKIFNRSFQEAKNMIGVLYEYVPLFYYSKVKEIIAYICSVYNIKKRDFYEIVKLLEIDKIENKLVKVLSKGERKKLGILMTIIHNPKFIIVDEPTSDLDPFMRDIVWKLFLQGNRTVFLTTHIWEEAEKRADKIAFILNGEIIAIDSTVNFLNRYMNNTKKIVLSCSENCEQILKNVRYYQNNTELIIYPDDINLFLKNTGIKNYSISDIELKDIFLHLTKNIHI
jgi:ABC-2 type transport system ATP-binding protein